MTLTTRDDRVELGVAFQMPVRSMTLTTTLMAQWVDEAVSDACQINDFDHRYIVSYEETTVSDACQINDFDHSKRVLSMSHAVSDACQINDFDHPV